MERNAKGRRESVKQRLFREMLEQYAKETDHSAFSGNEEASQRKIA